ncbi:DUF6134 family protein [Paracraurococcus ruber]|uniref:Uncharacterized protein n=1 Tax=Paracraurococcus ruber TaxID=77675 RepID=A0ABS1D2V8_9PROT|nr:DUF6134 family protein [Paracraurococcus ruber]MBK1660965.1 hypothetical protein [Paracraurococcus ruber]TDG28586.1 hypothetical protein E2C05_20285 [Paracraurococcus ruber]
MSSAGPTRRLLLALPPLAALPAAAAPAEYRFRVLRQGSAIGTHRVRITEGGGLLTALTEVDIAVRLLGVTVFRFGHRFEESWAGERLRRATSRQDRNGTVTEMVAEASGDGILASGAEGRFRLPPEAAPLSWWDARKLARPLFDSDSGKPLQLRWTREALPEGGTLWRAAGDEDSEGRYAADGTWTGWRTRAEDGSIVTYEPA